MNTTGLSLRKVVIYILNIMFVFLLAACGTKVSQTEPGEPETTIETMLQEEVKHDDVEESNIPENKYYIMEYPYADKNEAEYGNIIQEHKEFKDQSGSSFFYYDMECFYFDESYPAIVNETLQEYYNAKKESYRCDSEFYAGEPYEEPPYIPYDSLNLQCVTYAGDDYVSLLLNNVIYIGGAHPYSALEGLTIDCGTGEIVTVNRFTDDSDEEIGEQIKTVSGIDVFDPKDWDYCITDNEVVFFYFEPGFWDFVATKRACADLGGNKMEYEFDEIMGIDTLELNYEAHAAGFDGECFTFTVYFEEAVTDDNLAQINKAVDDFAASYNEKGIYIGYIDVSKKDDNAFIYLDLGNVEEDCNTSIHGILMALNNIPGIRTVILNE